VAREAYELALPASWRIHPVFHTSQLRPVNGNPIQEAAVTLEGDGEPEYEVERVLGERKVHGKVQYLVKWRGYGEWENSWEPKENLRNAQAAVRAFKQSGK
jgi:hypothetical protein